MNAGYTILGGRLSPPFDLSIEGQVPVAATAIVENISAAVARDLPGLKPNSRVGRHLAVVAGGPSISQHIETLRAWPVDGETPDVLAINGAFDWCNEYGIPSVFFAVDPHPIVARWAVGATQAIIASCCDPSVFDLLSDADVTMINLGGEAGSGGIRGGSSTAGMAPLLAGHLGYSSVTLFGCESSYALGATHAYQHEPRPDEILIVCNGQEFLTAPDYYMQARDLSMMIRALPEYLSEESGGLLRAMVADQDAQIRWMSQAMADGLTPIRDGKHPHCRIARVRPKRQPVQHDTGAGVTMTTEQLATTRIAAE